MPRPPTTAAPLTDRERDHLQALLEQQPDAPDICALDGFLVGLLLQPQPVPEARWLPWVHDFDAGRPAPRGGDLAPLHALVRKRHAELAQAITARRWFDPWVFELEGDDVTPSQMVLPWVAGWAAALERFPALLRESGPDAREPLATLFAHFDADDLEDVEDELAEAMAELEPPETLAEAVEDLVRCTLLLADAIHGPARRA